MQQLSRFRPSFGIQVAIGMAVGVALGFAASRTGGADGAIGSGLHTVGQIFVELLKALVPALVFTAIVSSIAALRDLPNAARLVGQTLLWFAITALIAVSIGIVLALTLQPGLHSSASIAAAAAAPARYRSTPQSAR